MELTDKVRKAFATIAIGGFLASNGCAIAPKADETSAVPVVQLSECVLGYEGWDHDPQGNVVRMSGFYQIGVGSSEAAPGITKTTYDFVRNTIRKTGVLNNGKIVNTEDCLFDDNGKLVEQEYDTPKISRISKYLRNNEGNVIKVITRQKCIYGDGFIHDFSDFVAFIGGLVGIRYEENSVTEYNWGKNIVTLEEQSWGHPCTGKSVSKWKNEVPRDIIFKSGDMLTVKIAEDEFNLGKQHSIITVSTPSSSPL